MKVVGGVEAEAVTDKDRVVEVLEGALKQIKSGDINPNRIALILVEDDVDKFNLSNFVVGRYASIIGFMEFVKREMLAEMGAD